MKKEKLAWLSLLLCTTVFGQTNSEVVYSQSGAETTGPKFFGHRKEHPIFNPMLLSISYLPEQSWDVDVTADYIYWKWTQDGQTSLGFRAKNGNLLHSKMKPLRADPGYASGFQIGAGFHTSAKPDWRICTEYTWYRNSASRSTDQDLSLSFAPLSTTALDLDIHRKISLSYDNADFLLQGPLYASRSLTASFLGGLEALFMTGKSTLSGHLLMDSELFDTFAIVTDLDDLDVHFKTTTWSLGPKFGFNASWLLGAGLKILTNMTGAVLYTQYSGSASLDADGTLTLAGTSDAVDIDSSFTFDSYDTLRAVTTAYIGLGWGYYLSEHRYHLDLSVGYDFNAYWNFVTNAVTSTILPSANLYLQGLNIKARFDF